MLETIHFNFPNLVNYENKKFAIKKENGVWAYTRNDRQYMAWDTGTNRELFELYNHHQLAKGHCICTGLGFLLRESLLLQNPNVTKITVIEIDNDLIQYHKQFNPEIMEKIEIINCDVYSYKGKCDTLLIDNFEGSLEQFEYEFLYSASIISKNITCDVMWFWPLEYILSLHYKHYIGLNLEQIYNNIKKYFDLDKLPILSEAELVDFCTIVYNGNFSKCDFSKINLQPQQ
jgi:predicted RNA methylase